MKVDFLVAFPLAAATLYILLLADIVICFAAILLGLTLG